MRKLTKKKLLKVLAGNLIIWEKIKTTEGRAKKLRVFLEPLISIAKKQTLSSYRFLLARLPKTAANKLFYEIAPRYKNRPGGYLRIIKHSKRRLNDGARMATIEFV